MGAKTTSIEGALKVLLTYEYRKLIGFVEQEIRDCAKSHIKEDCGGLTNSIYSVPYERSRWGGRVIVGVPYAYFVNYGRGEVYPKRAKVLSNLGEGGSGTKKGWSYYSSPYAFAPNGHSAFIAKYAGPFEGYHFVEEAIKNVESKYF